MTGPLSIHTYMKQSLMNPLYGYYMKKDVFGQKGDFTTSPEISQTFGEMIGIFIKNWHQSTGLPFCLVELGPGRGTFMKDILSVLDKDTSSDIFLFEASPYLKKIQQQNVPQAKHIDDLSELQSDRPLVVLGHEFLDALPIYKFKYTKDGWRELMIDQQLDPAEKSHFRYVLNKYPSKASAAIMNHEYYEQFKVPDTIIEVSPDAYSIAHMIAQRIRDQKGLALFVDYGHIHPSSHSFRAIENHEFVDPLLRPGDRDLTADVDFSLISKACENISKRNLH